MPYERNGFVSSCNEDCAYCKYGNTCDNYYEPTQQEVETEKEISKLRRFINDVVDNFYHKSYEARRVCRYAYLNNDGSSIHELANSKDRFYLYGNLSPANIQDKFENLGSNKKAKLKKFVETVDALKLDGILNFYNRDDDGCLFSISAAADINPYVNVRCVGDKKTYYVNDKFFEKYKNCYLETESMREFVKKQMIEEDKNSL